MTELYMPGENYEHDYFGGYLTRTFADIYPTFKIFADDWRFGDFLSFYDDISNDKEQPNLGIIYNLLYARYGNSHIAFTDENQFKANVMALMWQHAPIWQKRIGIQKALRNMDESEIIIGGKEIYNHSFNPSTAPSTNSLEELLTINDQNTRNYKRSKLDGYATLLALLEEDITEEFIKKFKNLFIKVLAPDRPLLYYTDTEETN